MKLAGMLFAVVLAANSQGAATSLRHVVVAREAGEFLAWRANHGSMRAWGDELLVPRRHSLDTLN